jgi:hypothetical protein
MIEQLIAKTFATRNAAHLAHWKTKSLSEHLALGEFYDGIPDLVDKIVESYQGAYALIGDVDIQPVAPKNMIKNLLEDVMWINKNREKISQGLSAIENLIDSLSDHYLSTIYKLKNLS